MTVCNVFFTSAYRTFHSSKTDHFSFALPNLYSCLSVAFLLSDLWDGSKFDNTPIFTFSYTFHFMLTSDEGEGSVLEFHLLLQILVLQLTLSFMFYTPYTTQMDMNLQEFCTLLFML